MQKLRKQVSTFGAGVLEVLKSGTFDPFSAVAPLSFRTSFINVGNIFLGITNTGELSSNCRQRFLIKVFVFPQSGDKGVPVRFWPILAIFRLFSCLDVNIVASLKARVLAF